MQENAILTGLLLPCILPRGLVVCPGLFEDLLVPVVAIGTQVLQTRSAVQFTSCEEGRHPLGGNDHVLGVDTSQPADAIQVEDHVLDSAVEDLGLFPSR